ncbi:hypothetical protein EYF80_023701 [Liparis tanakae]|uniref:Uncharacterized protein n=1 Tax=Liparis tanakae TaxID=230148 RepID=A0A4Z2HM55_9TELE|nr:hypothetical protein EYF80_023701 [Liparis tanakae]
MVSPSWPKEQLDISLSALVTLARRPPSSAPPPSALVSEDVCEAEPPGIDFQGRIRLPTYEHRASVSERVALVARHGVWRQLVEERLQQGLQSGGGRVRRVVKCFSRNIKHNNWRYKLLFSVRVCPCVEVNVFGVLPWTEGSTVRLMASTRPKGQPSRKQSDTSNDLFKRHHRQSALSPEPGAALCITVVSFSVYRGVPTFRLSEAAIDLVGSGDHGGHGILVARGDDGEEGEGSQGQQHGVHPSGLVDKATSTSPSADTLADSYRSRLKEHLTQARAKNERSEPSGARRGSTLKPATTTTPAEGRSLYVGTSCSTRGIVKRRVKVHSLGHQGEGLGTHSQTRHQLDLDVFGDSLEMRPRHLLQHRGQRVHIAGLRAGVSPRRVQDVSSVHHQQQHMRLTFPLQKKGEGKFEQETHTKEEEEERSMRRRSLKKEKEEEEEGGTRGGKRWRREEGARRGVSPGGDRSSYLCVLQSFNAALRGTAWTTQLVETLCIG